MSEANTNTQTSEKLVVTVTNMDDILAAKKGDKVDVSLTDLMNVLVQYKDPTPCYLFARTIPEMNKFKRGDKTVPNPYLGKIVKLSQNMVRINDDYEQAVIRRQMLEAAQRGEKFNVDEAFVADHPKWGARVGTKDMPALFEWWVPQEEKKLKWYMTVRPTMHVKTWYEWSDRSHPKFGQELTADEVKDLKDNYMKSRDDEMDAYRQDVDKPIPWRKYTFSNVLEMTIGGVKYRVVDPTPPKLTVAQYENLLKALKPALAEEMRGRIDVAG